MKADTTIAIIGAMEGEVHRLTSLLKNANTVSVYYLGSGENTHVKLQKY